MAGTIVYKRCSLCGGDGLVERNSLDAPGTAMCPRCDGSGYVKFGHVDGDLAAIEAKCDQILAALDSVCKFPGGE